MKTILIIGTLNTKESEAHYIKDQIAGFGHKAILLDISMKRYEPKLGKPDISNVEVAEASGKSIDEIEALERSPAIQLMIKGATKIVKELHDSKEFHGILGFGGSVGTSIVTEVEKTLPLGFPKVIVTTIPQIVGEFIGVSDIAVFASYTDMAGGKTVNSVEAVTLANAAAAISGMVDAKPVLKEKKPLIVASQFGNTTPHIAKAKEILESKGYEFMTFHAVGLGGKSLEGLLKSGRVAGVLDVTTHEVVDNLVGGVCDAGPERMEAAGKMGIPQVIVPGCLDMVNFWAPDTVPEKFKHRLLYHWDPMSTLMRTSKSESAELGRVVAKKVNKARGPTVVMIPLKGWSMLDIEGGALTVDYHGKAIGKPWYDPDADRSFIEALEKNIDNNKDNLEVVKANLHINDPKFVDMTVTTLDDMIKKRWKKGKLTFQ